MKILIADDHRPVRDGIRSLLLGNPEWDVCGEAENGVEAVAKAKSLKPDLVLMDISMPQMDGVEATRIIRTELPETVVILVSQNDPKVAASLAKETGACCFVAKSDLHRNLIPAIDTIFRDFLRSTTGDSIFAPGGTEGRGNGAADPVAPRIAEFGSSLLDGPVQMASLLAAIVDSSDDAIVSKNLDGIITSWNKSAERIFGYTASEAIGKHITLIIPKDRWQEETEILHRLRHGGHVDHFQTVRVRKDGVSVDISLTISPVRDANGHVVGASKVARDITDRRRMEERERQISDEAASATAKFRAVFEQTTQFAGIMDRDGKFLDANKLCLEACGYRAEEVLGKNFWDTAWWRNFPESRRKIRSATAQVAKGEPYREVLHYSWADGTERLVDFALHPIVNDEGRVLFLHPTGLDITDAKRNEANYRKLTESLEQEVRARTGELESRNEEVLRQSELLREFSQRFVQTQEEERRHIARELHDSAGQTLAVLSMNLAQLVHKAARCAPELANEAEKTQEIVQQLHREIRTTTYLLHPPLLEETGLASALSWYVQGLVERSGLQIALHIADDFGRLPREMELAAFRLVQECLTNVHRHSGSKTAEISVVRGMRRVNIDVSDQGKGMAPERLAEIQSGGTGVGIRGMRERMHPFDGAIEIDSDSRGTRVHVSIPLEKHAGKDAKGTRRAESRATGQ